MKTLTSVMRPWMVVCLALLVTAVAETKAQCVAHPDRETAVGVMNASNYSITVYIDGMLRGRLLPGERSIDFVISPSEHLLLAETMIGGELVSASRQVVVMPGSVCTWTVTDPVRPRERTSALLRDGLTRKAVISLASPN
jgi:hypothetical protein